MFFPRLLLALAGIIISCHGFVPRSFVPVMSSKSLRTAERISISVLEPFGKGLIEDIKRKAPFYASDWKDGFSLKSFSSTFFLFFACIAPAVVSTKRLPITRKIK